MKVHGSAPETLSKRQQEVQTVRPLKTPYIPEKHVAAMLVSGEIPDEMACLLEKEVKVIVRTKDIRELPAPVRSHPDMQMMMPGEGVIVHAPDICPELAGQLKDIGFLMIRGKSTPGGSYPLDIPYNVAVVGRHAFLNTRFADETVINWLVKTGKTITHVNQGYAKCSVCILNEEAVITSDPGICRAARERGIDVLLIPPQRHIYLPGYDYGFIGGATGLISENELAFCGDFSRLDSAEEILYFLEKHGITPVSLGQGEVRDLGSLVPLCTV